jgi:drug/metabolite transporter (DMT)-like permease
VNDVAVTAVLLSTVSHAWWNYQAKRAGSDHAFFGLAKWIEIGVYLPVFLWRAHGYDWPAQTPLYLLVAGALVGLNYVALSAAYARLDLSVAYPVSRTSTLFLPLIAWFGLGETFDAAGAAALLLVTAGVLVSAEFGAATLRSGRLTGLLFAAVAAATLAGYTVWDKHVVTRLDPFLYLYGYNVVVGLGYLPLLASRREAARSHWQRSRMPLVQVAILNTATYLLVLYALVSAKASYVGALRQLSLVAGLAFGVWLLGERFTRRRAAGVLLLVAGGVLATLAR